MNRRATDIVLAVVLAVATLLLYRKIMRLWWTYDDAYLLHIAEEHAAADHFVGGSIWRSMPQRLFTPLLTATYDSEATLFGSDARAFYVVELVLLCALAIALFVALRQWMTPVAAACASLVFMAGAPMVTIATELMLVHYVESLILCAIATTLFMRGHSLLSAVAYLAAMLAKEIAVPLIVVLAIVRRRGVVPHVVALVAYALWRRAALGAWVGGYGWALKPGDLPSIAAAFPRTLYQHLAGHSVAGAVLIALIVIGILALRRDAWRALVLLAVAIAPFLPMMKKFESRFAILLWLVCAVAAVAGFNRLRARFVAFAAVAVLALVVNRQVWASEYKVSRRMSDEARVFFALQPGDALRKPAIPPAAMGELVWLKGSPAASWFYDDFYLCDAAALPQRTFSFDEQRREVVAVSNIQGLRDRYCSSIRTLPLSASFRWEGESLFWTFGPHERGQYSILFGDGVQAFPLPRRDGFRLPGTTTLQLRVKYESPEGWVTYSPQLALDRARDTTFAWHR